MKKIYYTVDVEFHNDDKELGPTGNKTINVYTCENNQVVTFCEIECQLSDVSEKEIQVWLDNNGYGDQEYEFVQL